VPDGNYHVVAKLDTGPFKLDENHRNEFVIRRRR